MPDTTTLKSRPGSKPLAVLACPVEPLARELADIFRARQKIDRFREGKKPRAVAALTGFWSEKVVGDELAARRDALCALAFHRRATSVIGALMQLLVFEDSALDVNGQYDKLADDVQTLLLNSHLRNRALSWSVTGVLQGLIPNDPDAAVLIEGFGRYTKDDGDPPCAAVEAVISGTYHFTGPEIDLAADRENVEAA